MRRDGLFGLLAATAMLVWSAMSAYAFDETKYPNLSGQWLRIGAGSFDPTKPTGPGQEAPLTPEYQSILAASVASIASGGQGNNPMGACIRPECRGP